MTKRELGIHVTFHPNGEVGILDLDNRAGGEFTDVAAIDAQAPEIVERAVNAWCKRQETSPVQYSHTLRVEKRNGVERRMIFSLPRGR